MSNILRLGLIGGSGTIACLLATDHWGFAIKISSYFFIFLFIAFIWRLRSE